MTPRELEQLLGGYIAGSLTEAENSALMRAALEDQQLFDALADHEALRDALADPVFRARIRTRIVPQPPQRNLRWLWMLAAGLALVFVLYRPGEPKKFDIAATSVPQSPEVAPAQTPSAAPSAPAASPHAAPAARPAEARPRPTEPRPSGSGFPTAPPPPPLQAAAPPPPAPVAAEKKTIAKDEVSVTAAAPAAEAPPPPPPPPPAAPVRAAELRKSVPETDALAAAALDLQVQRSVDGRFESAELGALREGDRVRIRVRVPRPGTLVMSVGPDVARSLPVEPGRDYFLPDANGLPPGSASVDVAIALHPASTFAGERGNLFRARQQAATNRAGSAAGGVASQEALRDSRREDSPAKAKSAPGAPAAAGSAVSADKEAPQQQPPAAPIVRLHLEFKPR